MGSDLEKTMKECQERVSHGACRGNIILYLHRRGTTIIESMKVLKEVYNLSLGEAKAEVTAHHVWAEEVKSADILHEELGNALQKEDSLPSRK